MSAHSIQQPGLGNRFKGIKGFSRQPCRLGLHIPCGLAMPFHSDRYEKRRLCFDSKGL